MKKNIVIVILLLAVIGCAGYIGYDKLYLERQDQQENKEETNQPEETQTEEINTDSTFVEDLVGRYDYYFISDTNLENMLYTNDTTTPTELTEICIKFWEINKLESFFALMKPAIKNLMTLTGFKK